MKRFFLLLLSTNLCAGAALAAPTVVAGRVLNKTTGQAVAGAKITAVRVGEDRQRHTIATATSGAGGRFALGALQVSVSDVVIMQSNWQGTTYQTIVAPDQSGKLKTVSGKSVDSQNLQLEVYNSSRKVPISYQVHHIALEQKEKVINCTERIVVQNPTETTLIGDESGASIKLDIPRGARDVALDSKIEGTLTHGAKGYAVQKPIFPESYEWGRIFRENAITLTYKLDWPASLPWNRKIDLSHTVQYPTKFFFVNRGQADKDIEVVAPRLGKDQAMQIPGTDGQQLDKIVNSIGGPMTEEPALKPGETLAITIKQPVNPLVWAFVMFVGALIAIVPLVLRNSGGRRTEGDAGEHEEIPANLLEPAYGADVLGETFRTPSAPTSGSGKVVAKKKDVVAQSGKGAGISQSAQQLIFSIAQLDEEFAGGELDEKTYQSRRALWKKELVVLLDEGTDKQGSEKSSQNKK